MAPKIAVEAPIDVCAVDWNDALIALPAPPAIRIISQARPLPRISERKNPKRLPATRLLMRWPKSAWSPNAVKTRHHSPSKIRPVWASPTESQSVANASWLAAEKINVSAHQYTERQIYRWENGEGLGG